MYRKKKCSRAFFPRCQSVKKDTRGLDYFVRVSAELAKKSYLRCYTCLCLSAFIYTSVVSVWQIVELHGEDQNPLNFSLSSVSLSLPSLRHFEGLLTCSHTHTHMYEEKRLFLSPLRFVRFHAKAKLSPSLWRTNRRHERTGVSKRKKIDSSRGNLLCPVCMYTAVSQSK